MTDCQTRNNIATFDLMSVGPGHHVVNTVALAAPAASFLAKLPTGLTILCGLLGFAWYCVLFYDRFFRKG